MCVFGLKEGSSSLEVYRSGESIPLFIQEIRVFRRNRITRLILSDNELLLGVKNRKKLSCDYVPKDADNVSEIAWRSSDESVIKVDNRGHLIAVGIGICRVICTAENVSAQCICTVKPYLSEINIGINLEDDVLVLEPMDEYKLEITTFPADCIDGSITIESSDYNIVNVVKQTLYAKNRGNAVITVHNTPASIVRTFEVVVDKKKTKIFKKIFGKK
jgi:hypothetical protein